MVGMDQKCLQLLVFLMMGLTLVSPNELTDIAFPCVKEISLIIKALDYVCLGDKQDPDFERFLNEHGRRREKRYSKLFGALITPVQQHIEDPIHFMTNDDGRGFEEGNVQIQERFLEKNVIDQSSPSNLKTVPEETRRRQKRDDQGPDLLEKTMVCCENSHRRPTSCTLRDLKPYCEDFITGPSLH